MSEKQYQSSCIKLRTCHCVVATPAQRPDEHGGRRIVTVRLAPQKQHLEAPVSQRRERCFHVTQLRVAEVKVATQKLPVTDDVRRLADAHEAFAQVRVCAEQTLYKMYSLKYKTK